MFIFLKYCVLITLSIDPFHQFIWCKYLHLGETKPLFLLNVEVNATMLQFIQI